MTASKYCIVPVVLTFLAVCISANPVLADWDEGDPYKMHYPQLPNPNGWDVYNQSFNWQYPGHGGYVIADDFQCTETGPITDLHLWFSWQNDNWGIITDTYIGFMADDNGKPGDYLWGTNFGTWDGFFTPYTGQEVRQYGDGEQGWYQPDPWGPPGSGYYVVNDHQNIYQMNLYFNTADDEDGLPDFFQIAGERYWVAVMFSVNPIDLIEDPPVDENIGWKTSLNSYGEPAQIYGHMSGSMSGWKDLIDPLTGMPLDMAFVITPEPASVVLMGLGGLLLLRRR